MNYYRCHSALSFGFVTQHNTPTIYVIHMQTHVERCVGGSLVVWLVKCYEMNVCLKYVEINSQTHEWIPIDLILFRRYIKSKQKLKVKEFTQPYTRSCPKFLHTQNSIIYELKMDRSSHNNLDWNVCSLLFLDY